jgi:hypothetical protein
LFKQPLYIFYFVFALFTDDAGVYSCAASNHLGIDKTSAELIIPGNKRGVRF